MSLRWWEKTVEYQFVLLVAQARKLFLAPLDGAQERMGDAVLSTENRWVLIEFKKNATAIATEKEKFVSYQDAYDALSSSDAHHHIIYGQESKESIQRLQLCSQTYFSGGRHDLAEILSSGIEYGEFKKYVEQYTEFKKAPKGESEGGVTMDDLALVAGVNTDNNIAECLSLTEFQRELGLEHVQEDKLELGCGGLSL